MFNGLIAFAAPARADSITCTKTADPATHGGLQALLNHVRDAGSVDPVACIPSGTYSINFALVVPVTMRVIGTGATPPVINCAAATYCFDGTAGPPHVALRNLSMDGAHKADIQIGSGADGSPVVTGWMLDGITATGAGQIGIAVNNAADITITNATVSGNGSTPYDSVSNPTGDFGLRSNRVDGLTVQDSLITNNPTNPSPNNGFAGGAKFNTTSHLLVQHNHFAGNAGGGQLWIDISSHDFDVTDNTIDEVPTAGTGLLPNDAIRVEVSCAGSGGSFIRSNQLTGAVVAAIDLYDSSGITVQGNTIAVPAGAGYGVRMFGNVHGEVPDSGCQQAGTFPNTDNVAIDNTIDSSNTANALNGIKNVGSGISSGNTWTDNTYILRHCDPPTGGQWIWWDGVNGPIGGYAAWQAIGQDTDAGSSCTSIYPQVNGSGAFEPYWGVAGTVVLIHGSGFDAISSVKFNKVASSFTHTGSEITATVPAGATTGSVCVKNPLNTTCSITDFIVAPPVALAVATTGNGAGQVASLDPNPGLGCSDACQTAFPQGATVTLQATADPGSVFDGWGGDCGGAGTCIVTMNAAKSITATFSPLDRMLTVVAAGSGSGSITSNVGGIACPGACSAFFSHGTAVVLTATPTGSSTFAGWSGACSGAGACSVTLDAAKSVTGTFNAPSNATPVKDSDPAVAYNGWSGVIDATANGGAYRTSNVKNDRATWKSPIATSITWVTHTGPDQGKALVTIDGKNKGTVDLYAASAGSLSKAYTGLSNKAHTIVIKVLHTKSAASTGFNVRLDALVVGVTTTQESDPAIQYDTWKSVSQPKATDGTYRSSTSGKSTVTVTFTGTAIDWATTRGAAYGIASVTIDGVAKGTVDLYQPTTAWKALTSFTGLPAGSHTMVIQVLGLKNASSTSTKVIVDGFIVRS